MRLRRLLEWVKIAKPATEAKRYPEQDVTSKGRTNPVRCVMLFPYGITANVSIDETGLKMTVEEDPSNIATLPITTGTRPALDDGEIAFFRPGGTQTIIFRNDDTIEVNGKSYEFTAEGDFKITAATFTVEADQTFTGDQALTGNQTLVGNWIGTGTMFNNGKNVGDTHGHTQNNDSGGDTEQPISGVT